MSLRTNRGKVLILTPHAMTGALLGMLVELSQLEPVFADLTERPEDALVRHLPLLVIVADGNVDTYRSDLFLARAQHRGIGVVVFGANQKSDIRDWAQRHSLPYLELPTDAEAFGRVLDQATRYDRRARLSGDRRSPAHTERGVDRTLIFQAETSPYIFTRQVTFGANEVRVADEITGLPAGAVVVAAPRSSKRHVASADSFPQISGYKRPVIFGHQ